MTSSWRVLKNLTRLRDKLLGNSIVKKYSASEPPLRAELFSAYRMEQHGKVLAGLHKVSPDHAPERLLARLADNESVLLDVRHQIAEAVKAEHKITPAGEWLLDNFYLIEEQIRMTRKHLPKGYSRELPKLLYGPSAGLPRVYDIALETISHGAGRVDLENLSSFVQAYQTAALLNLGELWAIPIMLRLALIENLRRVAARIAADRIDRNRADYWADLMMETAEKDPKSLILAIADMARSDPPMVSAFVAELVRRLKGQGPALSLPLTWIEQRLSEYGQTVEQMVQAENQLQAADQVSISNSIGSLRFLDAMDWRKFVEEMSVVEQTLREDPGGVYGRMDFSTRDRYRHVIEKIARNSLLSESEVASRAIGLTSKNTVSQESGQYFDDRSKHVGFYLIDKGLPQLEQRAEVRLSVFKVFRRFISRFPLFLYLSSITLITLMFSGGLLARAYAAGMRGWQLMLIGILSLLCTSQLAVALANWVSTLIVKPRPLPRMDFSGGIPRDLRTLAVVPALLTGTQNIEDLIGALEVRFLANQDENLHFGLLTDFCDADKEVLPDDGELLHLARKRIEELNKKYMGGKNDTFFLFHRPRRWNPGEQFWMGYERKRGKIGELILFLNAGTKGAAKERFSLIAGDTAILSDVKYLITLDTDTQLPRDSARQFVEAMAHPLNRPQYSEDRQRVVSGYSILQPRLAVSLPGTNLSRYARIFGSEPGIDPYTRVVSDIYQDLFQEGSFIGKGIYDIAAFEQALKGRLPENLMLSHDLIEGCYARAGLLSDVQLYEEYPSCYVEDVKRRHRWIRGDWQIIQWLLPRVPSREPRYQKNPLTLLSRWKIFDNLRRSLVPSALTLLFLLGWTVLPSPWFWTLSALGIMLIPSLFVSIMGLLHKPDEVLMSQHITDAARSMRRHFEQSVFTLVCLPYEAFFMLDAIVSSTGRMLITHKRLLEWNPHSGQDHSNNYTKDLAAFCKIMWIAPLAAVAAAAYLMFANPAALFSAAPVLFLWFTSPVIAWWISRPQTRRRAELTEEQTIFLRKLSRKTWAFFETFVGPDDHWLPPDNYQENRVARVAHRTSPTNIGLALLANLSAYDFGYISGGKLIELTDNTLGTMKGLEQHRGHFYNWYDTQSLKPLQPAYISTVDSGNLAASLMILRSGLLSLVDQKILGTSLFRGLNDTLNILLDSNGDAVPSRLARLQKDMESLYTEPPASLTAARLSLDQLAMSAEELIGSIDADADSELNRWARAFALQCRAALDELTLLAPWPLPRSSAKSPDEISGTDEIPTLRELADLDAGSHAMHPSIAEVVQSARARIDAIERLVLLSAELAYMEYDFLYDHTRHLLTIGYNVDELRRDSGYYDLLASEARLCTFVAIAQGQLPQESWFALGRLLTTAGGEPVLLSWSGSMFEYLMPLLMMPTYEDTLLDQSYKAAVKRQIDYGRQRGVPWGMSESGYNMIDAHFNYQYRAFGVPGLGLKRGLAEELVIAPYSSVLALMVAPVEACLNLQRLASEGLEGAYGFYEAVDYTPSRQQRGQSSALVRSFMAHHQGMSLLSLAYLLLDRPMQKRFESNPVFRATIMLLQERVPKATAFYSHTSELSDIQAVASALETTARVFSSPDTPAPEVQLLSNGRYHVMITNAGGGYSRWKDLMVTRWSEDSTRDSQGTFCYLHDVESGDVWSTAYQPTLKQSDHYESIFSEAKAEFRIRHHNYDIHTEIAVSPEDDIEMRKVRISNRTRTRRAIDVTSYAEVVLAPPAADALHPAFSNLFVQTEIISQQRAVLCTRRPRSREEHSPWMFHLMAVHGAEAGDVSYETDRMRFIGRGNTVADPQAITGPAGFPAAPLSGSEGSVLDPVAAIRYRITLEPEESVTINIVTGIGETRDMALSLVQKYHDRRLADRVFDLAWTHCQVLLQQFNASEADAQLYGRLAGSILYADSSMRADPGTLIKNKQGQSALWGYAISGDLPIVLLQIEHIENINLVYQLVQAHTYWRLKGLAVDLVIWNEDHAGYRQLLHDQIMALIAASGDGKATERYGGIFVRPADQISDEDRILFQTVARVIITDSRGSLADQIDRLGIVSVSVPPLVPTRTGRPDPPGVSAQPRQDLSFFNGLGGFTPDGHEYVITTAHGQVTQAPWVNVLANPHFGTVISESGSGYTWCDNAHEFRLTPWYNDPVSDLTGEAFYLRDEESGHFWSPTPLPVRGVTPYVSRHGFGYSVFEHTERSIRSEMWIYVAIDSPVKFTVIRVRNESDRSRRLSATGYVEWVLGDLRHKTAMHVITELDPKSGALFARNPYNTEFSERVAFFDTDDINRTVSGDRTEFLGRNGNLRKPAALTQSHLSGRLGAALDPCAAIQITFDLAPGEEREIIFRLGSGRDADDASNIAQRFRGSVDAHSALDAVWRHWNHTLGAVQVETPDPAVNIMANGWLLYQTLACRIRARSGYYQSGGAFGFRDQLQDMMALIHAEPGLVREHLLLCASRQFEEGDVQHWWHPPSGRGVRTHCSDDFLWLPFVASTYVLKTGDTGVLDEPVYFIDGRKVSIEEDSYYDLPVRSEQAAPLYDHCVKAIMKGLSPGEHGLPLIGSGDWNDGMNMVGKDGKGESIWLGFFLYSVLMKFTEIARLRDDLSFAELCTKESARLRRDINQHGWDGEWYLRAFFDDGSLLGSAGSPECQIDSIVQSWSVLSGAGDPKRSAMAMEALDKRLVRRDHGLIQLLDPPFDKSNLDPGYIKGYVPGVRENGGQYTHAAIWAIMAFAKLGDSRRAWELLAMINPVNHGRSPEEIETYKVEPYVVAADVYAVSPHTGRGGWTWYTGSAGWMYRLIIESLLGLNLEVNKLRFTPCIPEDWESFKVHYRYRETVYHITVLQTRNSRGDTRVNVDGAEQPDGSITLVDDRQEHWVDIRIQGSK